MANPILSRRSRISLGTSPRMARSRTALQRPSEEIISSSGKEHTKLRRSVVRNGTRFSTEKAIAFLSSNRSKAGRASRRFCPSRSCRRRARPSVERVAEEPIPRSRNHSALAASGGLVRTRLTASTRRAGRVSRTTPRQLKAPAAGSAFAWRRNRMAPSQWPVRSRAARRAERWRM